MDLEGGFFDVEDEGEVFVVPSSAFTGCAAAVEAKKTIRGYASICTVDKYKTGDKRIWHEGVYVRQYFYSSVVNNEGY